MKKIYEPMIYKLELSAEKYFVIELPRPVEKMPKKDLKKFSKWAKDILQSIFIKSKIEAQFRYKSLLKEAEQLKQDYDLTNSSEYI